jgi:hypothetical protein
MSRALQTVVLAWIWLAAPAVAQEAIALGSRRELFVDRFLIDKLNGCRLELHPPRDEGIALKLDRPWEGPFCNYATVIKDGSRFLLYYRGIAEAKGDGSSQERTCVAESKDGKHWTRPELGLFAVPGSKDKSNNVVLADLAPFSHNFSPMLDTRPGAPASERFKALAGTTGLAAFVSADGFRWKKLRDEPVITKKHVRFKHGHLFDSQNLAFWSPAEECYVCYFRVWDGLRRIARTTSKDFVTWTDAVLMQQLHDDGSGPKAAPEEHLYTNQTSPYFRAPHVAIAIAARFMPNRQVLTDTQAKAIKVNPDYFRDTSDAVFMTTRGGNIYDRTFLEGFLRPGIGAQNWVSRTNYPALNVVQTGDTELSLYVNQDYAQPTNHMRRYSLRLDGFASVRAGYMRGELLTKPLTFQGSQLWLNFSTSAAGGLRVELQDAASGKPLSGFALADCLEMIGNEIERAVSWKGGSDVGKLAGRAVRLRVEMRDADLFALRFGDAP